MPNGCNYSRYYCATAHEAVFVRANNGTSPITHYLIQSHKLECQHAGMLHSMFNHKTLPLPPFFLWLSSALIFLSGAQKIRFLPPGYHHNSRLICGLENKRVIHLQICYYHRMRSNSHSGAVQFGWRFLSWSSGAPMISYKPAQQKNWRHKKTVSGCRLGLQNLMKKTYCDCTK